MACPKLRRGYDNVLYIEACSALIKKRKVKLWRALCRLHMYAVKLRLLTHLYTLYVICYYTYQIFIVSVTLQRLAAQRNFMVVAASRTRWQVGLLGASGQDGSFTDSITCNHVIESVTFWLVVMTN